MGRRSEACSTAARIEITVCEHILPTHGCTGFVWDAGIGAVALV